MEAIQIVVTWLVSAMVLWSPPGRSQIAQAKEAPEEGHARYEQIAQSLVTVAYDEQEKPIFGGPTGRGRTVVLMLSNIRNESGFRKDVDFALGSLSRGDHGRSWCLMQMNIGHGTTAQAWSGEDLINDRVKCFRAGLDMMRSSYWTCTGGDSLDRLSLYITGKCQPNGQSEDRIYRARTWLGAHAPPLEDAVVVAEVREAKKNVVGMLVPQ